MVSGGQGFCDDGYKALVIKIETMGRRGVKHCPKLRDVIYLETNNNTSFHHYLTGDRLQFIFLAVKVQIISLRLLRK